MFKWDIIPLEMRQLPQWVLRKEKVPVNPRTNHFAQGDNPHTWGTWDQVRRNENIGFELLNFIGIDFDHIWRYETPFCLLAREWATKIAYQTYCEYSLSGVGCHVFGNGDWIVPDEQKVFYDPDAPLVLVNKKEVPDVQIQFSTPYPGMVMDHNTKKPREGAINGRFYAITTKPMENTVSKITDISGFVKELYELLRVKYGQIIKNNNKKPRETINFEPVPLRIEPTAALRERINQMRPDWQRLIFPTKGYEVHALCRKAGKNEFLYWKGLFIEAQVCGITPQELYPLLKISQPAFDESTTEQQLPHHVFPWSRPFTNGKMRELFPSIKTSFTTKQLINRNHFILKKRQEGCMYGKTR